jgi:hypothetical protein
MVFICVSQEEVLGYVEALLLHILPGGSEENHEKPHSLQTVSCLKRIGSPMYID